MVDGIVEIKCVLCDSIDTYQFRIRIYNEKECLILDKLTDEFGRLYFKACYGLYKIIACNSEANPHKRCMVVLIGKNFPNQLLFVFNKHLTSKQHSITIKLTDQNYKNLPITRGRVILRVKNT